MSIEIRPFDSARDRRWRGRLSTPPHKLNEDQRSRFTVKDFEYTGEDLKDKVEPDYRGLKLSLSDYAKRFERRSGNVWEDVNEVRESGEYRVIYRKGSNEIHFSFQVKGTSPPPPPPPAGEFRLKIVPEGNWNFGEAKVGYGDLGVPLVYENIGNRDIPNLQTVLDCEPAGCFETSAPANSELLRIGERAEYFIRPKTGLSAGTYRGTLKVFSEGKVERKLNLSFIVKAASPPPPPPAEEFRLKITPEGSWNFGEVEVGYGDLAIPLIYENIGNRDIPNLQTVLDCEPAGCFETSAPANSELLRVGERAEYFIRPRSGLSAGTYRGTLKVFSEGKVERKLDLSFTVKATSPPPPTPELPIDEPYRVWSEQNDVPTDKEWHIVFSRAVDPASVDEAKIFIVRADRVQQPLQAELQVSEDGKIVHIRAKERYRKGMKYYLIIQKIRTVDGTVLKENILMPFVIAS